MPDKKPELSDAMKKKLEPKKFSKNPILGTKFTIAISSAKGGVGKSTFATNLALAGTIGTCTAQVMGSVDGTNYVELKALGTILTCCLPTVGLQNVKL